MASDALSTWDRERLATARTAFEDAMTDGDPDKAILAAIRAADSVKPPPDAPKPLGNPKQFFRKLEAALRTLGDPGTDVDTLNGFNGTQGWQDYWVTVEGNVWFISCRPNRRHTQLPLAPVPTRYDSLGRSANETADDRAE